MNDNGGTMNCIWLRNKELIELIDILEYYRDNDLYEEDVPYINMVNDLISILRGDR